MPTYHYRDTPARCPYCDHLLKRASYWSQGEGGNRLYHYRELCTRCGALCVNGTWHRPLFDVPDIPTTTPQEATRD